MKSSAQNWMRKEEYREPRAARPSFQRPTNRAEYYLSHSARELLKNCQASGEKMRPKRQKSPATLRAYKVDWAAFRVFCDARGEMALPCTPEIVAEFLIYDLEHNQINGGNANRVGRRVAAILHYHNLEGAQSPTDNDHVRSAVRGIRRSLGTATNKKVPVDVNVLVRNLGKDLQDLHDRALLLLLSAGNFRRAALVELDYDDLEKIQPRLKIAERDRAMAAVYAWCEVAGITSGPLFRWIKKGGKIDRRLSSQSVTDIVKEHAKRVGLDPSRYSANSLR